MNKYKIRLSPTDKKINIPIKIDFDNVGRGDLVDVYENEVIEQIINPIEDFEITRFGHKQWVSGDYELTKINHKFFFFDRSIPVDVTNQSNLSNWVNSYNFTTVSNYTGETFSNKDIYYFSNSFKRSFFKLDLYDSLNSETQKLYLTIIIPTQQGNVVSADIGTESVPKIVDIKTPNFELDYIGDKEGFFIYWLKDQDELNINEFYMSAKFFNAKTGQFVRMMTAPQSNFSKKFKIDKEKYFYRKVVLDYNTYEYEVQNVVNGLRIGTISPINWYEYINPS